MQLYSVLGLWTAWVLRCVHLTWAFQKQPEDFESLAQYLPSATGFWAVDFAPNTFTCEGFFLLLHKNGRVFVLDAMARSLSNALLRSFGSSDYSVLSRLCICLPDDLLHHFAPGLFVSLSSHLSPRSFSATCLPNRSALGLLSSLYLCLPYGVSSRVCVHFSSFVSLMVSLVGWLGWMILLCFFFASFVYIVFQIVPSIASTT